MRYSDSETLEHLQRGQVLAVFPDGARVVLGSVRFQTTEHNEATYPVLDAP